MIRIATAGIYIYAAFVKAKALQDIDLVNL